MWHAASQSEIAAGLSEELREVLEPLLREVEALSERIREYDRRIEQIAKKDYPEVALLQQVRGVGELIPPSCILTIEDPHRFRKNLDVGCFLGLRPGRRNSAQSEPQMHIRKEEEGHCVASAQRALHFRALSDQLGRSAAAAV